MKNLIKNFIVLTLPALLVSVLALEVIFRTVIPASTRPQAYFDDHESLWRFDSGPASHGLATMGRFAEQRAHWQINNDGWLSSIDYEPVKTRSRLAVVGDSYIEALQVDVDESYPALLRAKLQNEWDVYAFGVSGAPLSQYLHMIRYVVRQFDPDVIVMNMVHNDFDESLVDRSPLNVQFLRVRSTDQGIEEVPPSPDYSASQFSISKQICKNIAICRYLYYNLDIETTMRRFRAQRSRDSEEQEYNANIDVSAVRDSVDELRTVVDYVFGTIRSENPGRRIIVVMDAPRPGIYSDGAEGSDVQFLHALVAEGAKKSQFEFLDLTEPMKNAFDVMGERFESLYDGHWNTTGHRFVAEQLSGFFDGSEDQPTD